MVNSKCFGHVFWATKERKNSRSWAARTHSRLHFVPSACNWCRCFCLWLSAFSWSCSVRLFDFLTPRWNLSRWKRTWHIMAWWMTRARIPFAALFACKWDRLRIFWMIRRLFQSRISFFGKASRGLKQMWRKLDSALNSVHRQRRIRRYCSCEKGKNYRSLDVGRWHWLQNGNNVVSLAEIDALVIDMTKACWTIACFQDFHILSMFLMNWCELPVLRLVWTVFMVSWDRVSSLRGWTVARLVEQQGFHSKGLRKDHQVPWLRLGSSWSIQVDDLHPQDGWWWWWLGGEGQLQLRNDLVMPWEAAVKSGFLVFGLVSRKSSMLCY